MQYIPNLTRCFEEAARVLKKKGLFVFSFDHPFYTSISPKTFKIDKNYNKSGKYIENVYWTDGSKHRFVSYRRKISQIIDSINKSGLALERVIEPFDKKSIKAWRNGVWEIIYPQKLVELIGPTIIFKTIKK